ncbi:MAG: type IV pilin, partial [Methanomicrobiales archaeon]|nr:type IV pilin [Methanomicrobiales archaeon]
MEKGALSEVAGTMVLIGVVVVGMMIVNLVIISTPTNTRIPSLEASMTNRSTLITIVHQGGDSIPAGQYKILVDGVDQTGSFANSGGYPWSLGETLSYNGTSMPHNAIM